MSITITQEHVLSISLPLAESLKQHADLEALKALELINIFQKSKTEENKFRCRLASLELPRAKDAFIKSATKKNAVNFLSLLSAAFVYSEEFSISDIELILEIMLRIED